MASRSSWGGSSLELTVANGSASHNYAFLGMTTKAFRDEGTRDKTLRDIPKFKAMYDVRVTI